MSAKKKMGTTAQVILTLVIVFIAMGGYIIWSFIDSFKWIPMSYEDTDKTYVAETYLNEPLSELIVNHYESHPFMSCFKWYQTDWYSSIDELEAVVSSVVDDSINVSAIREGSEADGEELQKIPVWDDRELEFTRISHVDMGINSDPYSPFNTRYYLITDQKTGEVSLGIYDGGT